MPSSVSERRLAETVRVLAGDPFTGRRVGSPGGAAARSWLAERLAEFGAQVRSEPFAVRSVPEVYAAPTVTWFDGRRTRPMVFGRQVTVHLASADRIAPGRGGLAVAGSGSPAGRWLVVPAGMSLFDAYGHADGALGLLLPRAVDEHGWQYAMLAGPDPGPLPVLSLDAGTHAAVQTAAAKGVGWLSGNTLIRRRDVTGTNLHGVWPDRPGAAVRVLLTAHYDGVGDHPGLRQPAAADNASGVAVVLEAARVLAAAPPPALGLSVALLDAEEVGALGSAQHAAQLTARLTGAGEPPLVINVDGAGHLNQAAAVEAGGPAHRLLAALDQAGRHTGVPLAPGPMASDNRRYAAAGLPMVGIGAGMAAYHSPADTPDRVEAATMTALARLVVATVRLLTPAGLPESIANQDRSL